MAVAHETLPSSAGGHVTLEGVSCSFGKEQVLNELSVCLVEKRIGIIGRNGSGKSTLARIMAGLIAPVRGRVLIDGVDVLRDRKAAIRTVGILFQNPDHQIIFPTVEEEVAFGLRQLGRKREGARDGARAMLNRFGKAHWSDRSTTDLSQGQRHLVCLMAVLVMEPSVILLDEPFTGLDLPTTRALRRHLDGIEQTVIHITHDTAALENYERVLWLDDGAIRQDGAVCEVLPHYLSEMQREDASAGPDLLD